VTVSAADGSDASTYVLRVPPLTVDLHMDLEKVLDCALRDIQISSSSSGPFTSLTHNTTATRASAFHVTHNTASVHVRVLTQEVGCDVAVNGAGAQSGSETSDSHSHVVPVVVGPNQVDIASGTHHTTITIDRALPLSSHIAPPSLAALSVSAVLPDLSLQQLEIAPKFDPVQIERPKGD